MLKKTGHHGQSEALQKNTQGAILINNVSFFKWYYIFFLLLNSAQYFHIKPPEWICMLKGIPSSQYLLIWLTFLFKLTIETVIDRPNSSSHSQTSDELPRAVPAEYSFSNIHSFILYPTYFTHKWQVTHAYSFPWRNLGDAISLIFGRWE